MNFNFLISSERSGSNLITKIMDSHSQICGPSPKHIIRVIAENIIKYGELKQQDNWESLLDDLDAMLNSDFANWKYVFNKNILKTLANQGDIKSCLQNIYLTEAHAHNKKHLFIKELNIYNFFTFLEWCFPDAKYLYLVRDPRDMALSYKENVYHPGGIVQGAIMWRNNQQEFLKPFFVLHKMRRVTVLRYEDLLSDTENQLTRICQFFEVEFEAQMLDFFQNPLTQENAKKLPSWKNLSQALIKENFNKFKNKLTAEEIAIIEIICWHHMIAFGYEPISSQESLKTITNEKINALNQKEFQTLAYRSVEEFIHVQIEKKLIQKPIPEINYL